MGWGDIRLGYKLWIGFGVMMGLVMLMSKGGNRGATPAAA